MNIIALIENGIVENIIVTDDHGWPGGIDITEIQPRPGIGWHYDEDDGFTDPAPEIPAPPDEPEPAPEPIPQNRIITNYAFEMRFTLDERVAIDLAGLDDPTAALEQRAMAAALRVSQERAKKAQFTDLDNPVVRASVEQMETIGLLAEGRAAEILDAPVLDEERP